MLDYECFATQDLQLAWQSSGHATCMHGCQVSEDNGCFRLGGYTPNPPAQPLVEAPEGTSLFCFDGSEAPDWFIQDQRRLKRGIFDCDAWEEFTGLGLHNIWHKIHSLGTYAHYDWTVRVDSDTVWIPGRLREHLGRLLAPSDLPMYLSDEGDLDRTFAVLSAPALQAYIDGYGKCAKYLDQELRNRTFLQACLDALGVSYMEDPKLLRHDVEDTQHCGDYRHVAFRLRADKLKVWNECWGEAQASSEWEEKSEARAVMKEDLLVYNADLLAAPQT